MKPYVYISGLTLRDNNRGTVALGYGAIEFLKEKGLLLDGQTIIGVTERNLVEFIRWIVKVLLRKNRSIITINGKKWLCRECSYLRIEKRLVHNLSFLSKLTLLHSIVKKTGLVAAINGGDGFSDIYGEKVFFSRLFGIHFSMENGIPLVMLPQTIGPFYNQICLQHAKSILEYSSSVFVRDNCFCAELDKMDVNYELTNDLSYFMKPEPWDIGVDTSNAVGINVSGLAWDNQFHTLKGQFDYYRVLVLRIIQLFQEREKTVYLISHSYNYRKPEYANDDLKAAREVYKCLKNKQNVILVDRDLTSPQVKYLISRMSFFVGTRMHANYAAIFTKVPLFGLAYSYKFQGAFENNGIYNRTARIDSIDLEGVESIVRSVERAYNEDVENL